MPIRHEIGQPLDCGMETEKKKSLNQQVKEEKQQQQQQNDTSRFLRRTIEPSRSKAKLMRQVSGLGMEDPVFRTTESGPEHPSNIFDDMGVTDIPTDMMDMVSVASDPTATEENGFDIVLFQMSLSTTGSSTNGRPSLRECSLTQSLHSHNNHRTRSMLEPASPSPPRMVEENSFSSFAPQNSLSSKDNINHNNNSGLQAAQPQQHMKRKNGIRASTIGSTTSTAAKSQLSHHHHQQPPLHNNNNSVHSYTRSYLTTTQQHSPQKSESTTTRNSKLISATRPELLKEPMNISMPSLDLEAVFGTGKSQSSPFTQRKKAVVPTHHSSTLNTTHTNVSSSHHTDTLLAEAAEAMEGLGCPYVDLIETAKRQHTIAPAAPVANNGNNASSHHHSHGYLHAPKPPHPQLHHRRYSTGIFPIQENTTPEGGSTQPPPPSTDTTSATTKKAGVRQRCLPTLANLFPQGDVSGSISRAPSRTSSTDSNSSSTGTMTRRRSVDVGMTSRNKVYSEYQPHTTWNRTADGPLPHSSTAARRT